MGTITYTDRLTIIECYKCHISFAMPEDLDRRARQDDNVTFYCPNGHGQGYVDTEIKRLRREKERLERQAQMAREQRDFWEAEQRRTEAKRRGQKAQTTRLKNRIAKGVCPCCNRSFVDVARHMESQHPDFGEVAGG